MRDWEQLPWLFLSSGTDVMEKDISFLKGHLSCPLLGQHNSQIQASWFSKRIRITEEEEEEKEENYVFCPFPHQSHIRPWILGMTPLKNPLLMALMS